MLFHLPLNKDFDLKIGAHWFEVRFVEDVLGSDRFGLMHMGEDRHRIYILRAAPYGMRLSTFLHEVMHAFEALHDFEIDHKDLNRTADLMAAVFVDNFETIVELNTSLFDDDDEDEEDEDDEEDDDGFDS